jgi:predicted ATPase
MAMHANNERFFVPTGGPASVKTTLIEARARECTRWTDN